MRFKSIIAALFGLLFATALAAQTATAPAFAPPPPLDPQNTLLLDLSTGGRVAIQLRPDIAPNHVERIKTLARRGFYNGVNFHRVIEGFMAQTGDPTGTGEGGSELANVKAEFNDLPHVRGAVSMARTGDPDSANSQFFIMFGPRLTLDHKYTVFGRVVSGMNYVDLIERGEPPATPSRILRASIAADNVPPPAPGEVIPPPVVPAPAATPPAAAPATTPPATPDASAAPATPDAATPPAAPDATTPPATEPATTPQTTGDATTATPQ